MANTFNAVYRDGAFYPEVPPELPEGSAVKSWWSSRVALALSDRRLATISAKSHGCSMRRQTAPR
jgi:hypothetical protein